MIINNQKEAFDFLRKIEKKYSVFQFKIAKKTPFWAYVRPDILKIILFKSKLSDDNSIHSKKPDARGIWKSVFSGCTGFFKLLTNGRCDYVFFETPRRVDQVEPYLSPYYQDIKSCDYIRLCYTELWKFDDNKVIYLNFLKLIFIGISVFLSPLVYIFYHVKMERLYYAVKYLHDSSDRFWFYRIKFAEFLLWHYTFYMIFKLINPQKVFFSSSTFFIPIIAACDKLGIETVEVQHGLITKYSPEYNFSDLNRDGLFAQTLLLMGPSWLFVKDLLPKGVEVKSVGSLMFIKNGERVKNSRSILFISQKPYRKFFITFIRNNKSLLKNYNLIFKLHPMEYFDEQDIEDCMPTELKGKIQFVNNEFTMQQLHNSALCQIGCTSNALVEGVQRGVPTLILDTPLRFYLDFLNDVIIQVIPCSRFDSFSIFINKFTESNENKNIFFSPIDEKVVKEIVSRNL
tara:strand:- start:614 stop:1987 length:1374 start_codon:yes stop_codon:yes gene_type:complete